MDNEPFVYAVYDISLRVACMSDPCSVVKCGHQATCFQEPTPGESIVDILQKVQLNLSPNKTSTSTTSTTTSKPEATCRCKPGFVGNPFERCFPQNVTNGCGCERLVFTSKGYTLCINRKHFCILNFRSMHFTCFSQEITIYKQN